jgi:hypothetical protein
VIFNCHDENHTNDVTINHQLEANSRNAVIILLIRVMIFILMEMAT